MAAEWVSGDPRGRIVRADTRKQARAIAEFLAGFEGPFRVGEIAQLNACPIPPPQNDAFPYYVGHERHCQKITAALEAAVRLGLVEKTRGGAHRGGPWLYRAKVDQ